MHAISVLTLIALATPGSTATPHTDESAALVSAYIRDYTTAHSDAGRERIPAWARKYNMNCDGCHYPAPPRLNGTGQRFKWAGYRMPEEIGESVDAARVSNYLAAGAEAEYEWEKTDGEPVSANGLSTPGLSLFYAGPFGRAFSAYLELEVEPEGEIERLIQIATIWGREGSYGGFRAGQIHNLGGWGVAGFDRLPGISSPTPLDGSVTSAVPFVLGEHQFAVEGYYVAGPNRLSAQILNGINAEGEAVSGDVDTKKDFLVTNQVLLDDAGSGIQAVGYYGTVVGLDEGEPDVSSHFWRLAVSANKIYRNVELLGGLVYGKDLDLPAVFASTENEGLGYWFSGQYFVPSVELTLFGRYEFVDPNTDVSADARRRFVLGTVLPLTLPQYLRWALEYRLDSPQGGLPKTNNITTAVVVQF